MLGCPSTDKSETESFVAWCEDNNKLMDAIHTVAVAAKKNPLVFLWLQGEMDNERRG